MDSAGQEWRRKISTRLRRGYSLSRRHSRLAWIDTVLHGVHLGLVSRAKALLLIKLINHGDTVNVWDINAGSALRRQQITVTLRGAKTTDEHIQCLYCKVCCCGCQKNDKWFRTREATQKVEARAREAGEAHHLTDEQVEQLTWHILRCRRGGRHYTHCTCSIHEILTGIYYPADNNREYLEAEEAAYFGERFVPSGVPLPGCDELSIHINHYMDDPGRLQLEPHLGTSFWRLENRKEFWEKQRSNGLH